MWTRFMDMHSGGGTKEKWSHIYIEAPEDEAKVIFYNRFDHNPNRITCACCGEDYSISSDKDLARLTAFDRACTWEANREEPSGGHYIEKQDERFAFGREYRTLDEYMNDPAVLFIHANEIKAGEREGTLAEQGWVWIGEGD